MILTHLLFISCVAALAESPARRLDNKHFRVVQPSPNGIISTSLRVDADYVDSSWCNEAQGYWPDEEEVHTPLQHDRSDRSDFQALKDTLGEYKTGLDLKRIPEFGPPTSAAVQPMPLKDYALIKVMNNILSAVPIVVAGPDEYTGLWTSTIIESRIAVARTFDLNTCGGLGLSARRDLEDAKLVLSVYYERPFTSLSLLELETGNEVANTVFTLPVDHPDFFEDHLSEFFAESTLYNTKSNVTFTRMDIRALVISEDVVRDQGPFESTRRVLDRCLASLSPACLRDDVEPSVGMTMVMVG